MDKQTKKKVSIVYYQDLHSICAGGVLTYIHGFIKHANNIELSYWGKKEKKITERPKTYNLAKENYYCCDDQIKFVPEMLRIIFHLWRSIPKIEAETDVIFIQWTETAIPWIFRKKKKPLVVIFHGDNKHIDQIYPPLKTWFYRLADKLALRSATKVIFVSHSAKDYYQSIAPWAKDKFQVIHTFAEDSLIPTETKEEAKEILKIPQDRPVISFAGRFHPPKRICHMVRVFAKVKKKHPEALLYMAGDGSLREEAESLIRERELEQDVILPGMIPQQQVSLLFRASEVSLLLTNFEGTPMSLLESLACGTPVVLSNVSDHKKIITNGKNGYVIENTEGDQQIADKISLILETPKPFQHHAQETGKKYLASQIIPKVVDVLTTTS